MQEYNDRIQLLEIELQEHSKADFDYKTTIGTIVSLARRAKSIFENCSEPAKKRMFLSNILQNPRIIDGKLDFSIASPFDLVLKLSEDPSWLPILDEFRTLNWNKIINNLEIYKNMILFTSYKI